MHAIVRFGSDKSIHHFSFDNLYDYRKLLSMENVVWMQVISDTGMVIQPSHLDQSKLDIKAGVAAYARPLRPKDAWMPVNDKNAEREIDELTDDIYVDKRAERVFEEERLNNPKFGALGQPLL